MPKKPLASFWLNSMFYTMLQRVSLFVFGVAAYMILVRGFSLETNGVWALYIALFSVFEAVKQGLLRNSTIKFLGQAQYADKKNAVQSSSLLIHCVFSVIVIILVFISGQYIADWLQTPNLLQLLLWSTLLILLLIPFNHCEILMQAAFRFDILFRAAFIRQGIFLAGILLLYFFYRDYFTLLNVLLAQLVALIAGLLYLFRSAAPLLITRYIHEPGMTNRLFQFGKFTFGTNLFAGLSRSFDHFITAGTMQSLEGKNFVAYYNTVARINNMVDVPSLAAADVLYPKNVEALEKEGIQKVKHYFEQMTGTILAFVLPLSLFIFTFPHFIIDLLAGPEYYPAATILQLTILFSIVRPLSYQFGSTLDAIGKPRVNFWANACLMILNLLLTYVFLKKFGGMGPAYATMICYSVSFAVMLLILRKHLQLDAMNILRATRRRYAEVYRLIIR